MSCHEVLAMLMRQGDAGYACLGYLLAGVLEVAHISLLIRDEGVRRSTHLYPYFIFVPSVARRSDREVPWPHFNGFWG